MTTPPPNRAGRETRSREEIAKVEIGHTESTPGINRFLVFFFVVVVSAVMLVRNITDVAEIRAGAQPGRSIPQSWDPLFFAWPTRQEVSAITGADSLGDGFAACAAVNKRILADITTYERELKDRDAMVQWLIPHMQSVITGWLRGGNEDAYCGQDGWLFYRRDVDSLTGRGFLEPAVLKKRAASGSETRSPPQPDPLKAIIDFRDQLARRGITLVLLPVPVKPSVYPEYCSHRYPEHAAVVQNPSFDQFMGRLAQAGVAVFDASPLLAGAKTSHADTPLYLKTDTHWTPTGMELVARGVAEAVRNAVTLPPPSAGRFTTTERSVRNLGDVAMMLKLPAGQGSFPPETVQVRQVLDGGHLWRADAKAEILLLGDSFSNIYSLEPMGWGEASGLAEHLSLALGLPIDAICRNDAGSHATREMLAKELQRGNDRLAGKKVVVWEFAARELAFGDWKLLPLELGEGGTADFYTPKAGRTTAVQGTIRAISFVPRPGSVPYKDHIFSLHLTGIASADDPAAAGKEAVVFAWSMRDNQATPAARHRVGDTVHLRLQPWTDVAVKYEAINRSEIDDDHVRLADPAWMADGGPEPGAASPARGESKPENEAGKQPDDNPSPQATTPTSPVRPGQAVVPATTPLPATEDAALMFRRLCATTAAAGDSMAIPGKDGWLFSRSEVRHIGLGTFWGEAARTVSKATSPDKADPLPAIVDFHEQLKALGIELIFAPVPCKALIHPEQLGGAPERLDVIHQQFFQLLRDKGVTVLDLAEVFFEERNKPGTPALYCRSDTHWSPYGCEVTARTIKGLLGSPAWLKARPGSITTSAGTRTIIGDLTNGQGSEELPIRLVESPGATLNDNTSPIVLLGDSHTLVYHVGADLHGTNAGLADQLAAELGIAVDVIGVRGSGATPARVNLMRRARANPAYLAGKKVVIWCFTEREFTESPGWSVVRLTK